MIMQIIGDFFGMIMYFCYRFTKNYGMIIIIFTLLTKIVMLPISIMVQKNSIKMVKMYPEMNRIKARWFGNKDMISEEQYKLYKKEKYNPMLDLIPVILQLVILMGVIDAIYKPLKHLLKLSQEYIQQLLQIFSGISGIGTEVSSIQIQLVDYLNNYGNTVEFQGVLTSAVYQQISTLDMKFCGLNLGVVPLDTWGISILIPLLAAASSWLMCAEQNRVNVLQSEQSKVNQWTTLLLSVGLSLYLGFFVPAGVGFYWTVSNLVSIIQMYILNYFINPRKYINYTEMEESKKELQQMEQYAQKAKDKNNTEYAQLEKADYKRFLKYGEKQLVFYSEGKGFYKYFKDVIENILKKTDITIHYITSDPKDDVFELQSDNFRVYYIGENKLIVLMMKMDADMVVMTMPDLQKYHIKRSMIRNDIEYIYMDHGINSINLMLRKHALDSFDTIFAANDIVYAEIKAQEEKYNLKEKNIVKYGYALIDNMISAYENQEVEIKEEKTILIAPSWQTENILDTCIEKILEKLLGQGYNIILRPHPQYVRHFESKLIALREKYSSYKDFILQMDFSSNSTVFNADILITDWSGIGYEYSFTTLKPTLYINTPMKMMNPDYEEIQVVPFDLEVRDKLGISVNLEDIDTVDEAVKKLLTEECFTKEALEQMRRKYLYNVSKSAQIGADYIIRRLIEMSQKS